MEVERNLAVIISGGAQSEKRESITSTRFEIRKASDPTVVFNNPKEAERSQKAKLCYRMADLMMTMCIVFPLSIGVWRGIWQLMEYYSAFWGVDPWLSIVLGYLIPFVLYWYQVPLKTHVIPGEMNFISFYLISRALLLLHSFGCISQWMGVWKLLDQMTGFGATASIATLIFGTFFNLIFRTFSNNLAPPLLCCVDEAFTIHDCPLRFKSLVNLIRIFFMQNDSKDICPAVKNNVHFN